MKKTISVNLKGTNFIIEEDAYNRLETYLTKLLLNRITSSIISNSRITVNKTTT